MRVFRNHIRNGIRYFSYMQNDLGEQLSTLYLRHTLDSLDKPLLMIRPVA